MGINLRTNRSGIKLLSFLTIAIFVILQGCGNDKELKGPSSANQAGGTYNGSSAFGQQGQSTFQPVNNGNQTQAGFGTGDLPGGLQNGNGNELKFSRPTEYPSSTYSGSGMIYHRGGDDWIKNKFGVNVSANSVAYNSSFWDSERDEVRDNFRNGSLGTTTWKRPSPQELHYREQDDSFVRYDFLIYGTTVTDNKGRLTALSSPIPILTKPMDYAQYRHIAVGQTITYTATTRGHLSYNMNFHVKKESEDGINVTLTMIHEIVGANKGREYEKWPVPYKTTFTINTQTKRVDKIRTDSKWYESKKDRERTFHVSYGICSHTFKGQTDTYNCPK